MTNMYVESVHSYPVKSCAPLEADSFAVTEHGLQYDREWMVARPNGTFISQRNFPTLALIKPETADGELLLTSPEDQRISIPLSLDEAAEEIPVTIFEKAGTAIDEGDEAAQFFSDHLSANVRLLRSVKPRPINPRFKVEGAAESTRFADGYPLSIASSGSLALLNGFNYQRLTMSRFRPNIVIDVGDADSFDEDFWREIKIGDVSAFIIRTCARCPIPDVNQQSGKRSPSQPAKKALTRLRSGYEMKDGEPDIRQKTDYFFGQNVTHTFEPGQTISVNDPVTVVSRSDERNFVLLPHRYAD